MTWLPETLRARLALWYGVTLSVVLVAFAFVVYLVAVVEPDDPSDPKDIAEADLAAQRMLVALAVALPAALVVAVGGGWLLSRRELSTLERIVDVTEGLSVSELEARVAVDARSSSEIARLVQSLNQMLDRMHTSVDGLRRFTADASHELRTPIALDMGNLEVALRRPRNADELARVIGGALEELTRLTALVEALLTLARSDAGELPVRVVAVDVRAVIDGVVESYAPVAADRELSLAVEPDVDARGPMMAQADALWLSRALANLVDNACKLAPRGTAITIVVVRDEGRVRIEVGDRGPGVSAEDRPRLFQRFFRSESVRGTTPGFGLGLSLARDIVRALGGDLVLLDDGAPGARFSITLRAA